MCCSIGYQSDGLVEEMKERASRTPRTLQSNISLDGHGQMGHDNSDSCPGRVSLPYILQLTMTLSNKTAIFVSEVFFIGS